MACNGQEKHGESTHCVAHLARFQLDTETSGARASDFLLSDSCIDLLLDVHGQRLIIVY